MKKTTDRVEMLESPEALAFQRTSWRGQRIGWGALGLLLVLAALGGLGDGPLTRASRGSAEAGFGVRYHRVWRLESPAWLVVTASPGADGTLSLTLPDQLLGAATMENIAPEPGETIATPAGTRLVFRSEGPGPMTLRLGFTPHRMGRIQARLLGPEDRALDLSFFVLP
jgi:hypothetical protein